MSGHDKDPELDLVEVLRTLWARRMFILKVTCAAGLAGVLAAVFTPKEYTAGCLILPQGAAGGYGGLSGSIAHMAGLAPGQMGEDVMPAAFYPDVVASIPFQRRLMQVPVVVSGRRVTLREYVTGDAYRRFSPGATLKKYTIGLPGLILGAVRGGRDAAPAVADTLLSTQIEVLTREDMRCVGVLRRSISANVNPKEGGVSLMVKMPDPVVAAQAAEAVRQVLQQTVIDFRIEKSRIKYEFIDQRYREAKAEFEARQRALAAFRDANRNIATAVGLTREEQLKNEYTLALAVYSELASQREEAAIKVKEDTPTFALVQPVSVPLEPSAPRRGLIVTVSVLLGVAVAAALVWLLPCLAAMCPCKCLDGWREQAGAEDGDA